MTMFQRARREGGRGRPTVSPLTCALLVLAASCGGVPSSERVGTGAEAIISPRPILPPHPLPRPAVPSVLSTARVLQLTGDIDAEHHNTQVNRTSPWGVDGVDLGANTFFKGRTYFFFGDVPELQKPDASGFPAQDADLQAYLEDIHVPEGAHIATGMQGEQLDAFYVGADGALWVLWTNNGGWWCGPQRITRPSVAPPGANLATGIQWIGGYPQLDVFVVGNSGEIEVSWVPPSEVWQDAVGITRTGVTPAGSPLVTVPQVAGQLDVAVVGYEGAIDVTWVQGGGTWVANPVAVTRPGTAPIAAPLALATQPNNQNDLLYVGAGGALYVTWATGPGAWQYDPVPFTRPNVAPAGANIATAIQVGDQVDAFVVGGDGALYVTWAAGSGAWQYNPVAITPGKLALGGASVSAARRGVNELDVAFAGSDGTAYLTSVLGGGTWAANPIAIAPSGSLGSGANVVLSQQLPGQLDALFTGSNAIPQVSWVVAGGAWQGPAQAPSGFYMTPVSRNGVFYPFTIEQNGADRILPTAQTPTGAFGYGNALYIFAVEHDDAGVWFSELTRTRTPGAAAPVEWLFEMSRDPARFLQVAPQVVNNALIPGLPSSTGDGVIMFGNAGGNISLAWMPLSPGDIPTKSSILYYTGNSAAPWSPNETDAHAIITIPFGWTSISTGQIPGTGKWMFVYQMTDTKDTPPTGYTGDPREGPIMIRIADSPMLIEHAPDVPLFDPVRDNALGNYMYWPSLPDPNDLLDQAPTIRNPSFAYGAYILSHFTSWDDAAGRLTLYYTLSLACPYQVQVMKSEIAIPRSPFQLAVGSSSPRGVMDERDENGRAGL